MNVLVLGDMHFDNIYPLLRRVADRIVVMATRPPDGRVEHGAEVEWRYVAGTMDRHRVLTWIEETQADLVLSRVRGTENESDILEHVAAAKTAPPHVLFPVHSEKFAEIAADKARFHQVALEIGLPVPRGAVGYNFEEALAWVDKIGGFPAIVKQSVSYAGQGVYCVRDNAELERLCKRNMRGPFVLQEVVEGEEIGIEIITGPAGSLRFPLISMGRLDSTAGPQGRLRTAPYVPSDALADQISDVIAKIETALHPMGPWQMDLAVRDERLYVLEINARLGGLSNLSHRSTDLDPHEEVVRSFLGYKTTQPKATKVAMEIPVVHGAKIEEVFEEGMQIYLQPSRSQPNSKLVISAKEEESGALLERLEKISPDLFFSPLADILDQIKDAFRTIK